MTGFFPFPDFFEKSLTTYDFLADSFFCEIFRDDILGRDTSMICPRYPESFIAFHTMVANHDILNRDHERMTSMEYSRDIWRRKRDIECLTSF